MSAYPLICMTVLVNPASKRGAELFHNYFGSVRGRVKTPNIKILNSLCVHLWMRNEFFIFL